jgi:uncharacterized lipoprotein YddW (UPF0748 family)
MQRLFRTITWRLSFALLLSPLLTVSNGANSDWQSLGIFNSKADSWTASDKTHVVIQQDLYHDSPGLKANIRMKPGQERIYVDRACDLNLADMTEFSLAVRIVNPQAVSRVSLYFKSGAGWYGGWFTISGSAWQTVSLSRRAFGSEGKPTGWSSIDGVRIAFWKGEPQQTTVEVALIQGRSSSISILRNSAARESLPDELAFINRSTDRLAQWFSGYGFHTDIIDDQSLANERIPDGCRILILPFNPVITPTVQQALHTFTERGGRLIVMYGLTDELAPILGLNGKRWASADPPDLFSSIHITRHAVSGAPESISQDSWNANIPEPSRARVIGTWHRANGQDTGLPAITIDKNGAFIGHVLTNIDREKKMQLLLALCASLSPDLIPMLERQLWLNAEKLFTAENWQQTRAYIESTARKHRQHVQDKLSAIERLRSKREHHDTTNDSFGMTIRNVDTLRSNIRQAYFLSVSGGTLESEFRGVWCHNASGPTGYKWDRAVRTLKQSGFNALFANQLWAGVAYYPSDILPVAPTVSTQGDLLQQCLDACKREGIAYHLWSVMWVLDNAPDTFVNRMKTEGRLVIGSNGQTRKWLCPANPLNVALAAKAAVEAVNRYDIDGFHLDYIRYPDADACFCQHCARRFRQDSGLAVTNWPAAVISGSDKEAYRAWRRNRITEALTQVRDAVKEARPSIQVSAAVWGNWPDIRDSIAQDWVNWCLEGKLDFVTPMNYVTTASEASALYARQRTVLPARFPIYPGIAPTTYNLPPEETVRQVDTLRQAGAKGFALFELDPDLIHSHLPALRAGATSR